MFAFESADQGSIRTLVSLEFSATCAIVLKIKSKPIDRAIFFVYVASSLQRNTFCFYFLSKATTNTSCAEGVGGPDPLINHGAIGIPSNICPKTLENHKATNSAFNVGPPSADIWP